MVQLSNYVPPVLSATQKLIDHDIRARMGLYRTLIDDTLSKGDYRYQIIADYCDEVCGILEHVGTALWLYRRQPDESDAMKRIRQVVADTYTFYTRAMQEIESDDPQYADLLPLLEALRTLMRTKLPR